MAAMSTSIQPELRRAAKKTLRRLDEEEKQAYATYNAAVSLQAIPTSHPDYRRIEQREHSRLRRRLKEIEIERRQFKKILS